MADSRAVASAIANDAHVKALYDAVNDVMDMQDTGAVLVQLIDFAPAAALPYLAQQYDVLGYKGYGLCATDDQRRAVIKASIANHKIRGTPASIEAAIRAIGFIDAEVTERTGIYYDGVYSYDGSKPYNGWKWYYFDVEVYYQGAAPNSTMITMITKMINIYKAARSQLFNLKFTSV